MKTIATFEIEGSFKLTRRGLVVYGDIINGTVTKGNFFCFNNGQQKMKLKIIGVDFVDNIKEKITKIGLTLHYDNDKQKESFQTFQVTKQTATITEL